MSLNEPRLAEENFDKALRLAPRDPEISNNYGWFLCQTKRERESLAYFNAAIRNPLYATPTKPNTNAGICAMRLKDDKAAEAYFLEALRSSPDNTQAMYWLGELTYRQGRYPEAKQWVAGIDKLQEPTAEQNWLALRIERKLGNREAEARLAADLRKRFANSPEYRQLLQGQYE
jgi:type IV pilus assembly protein PilF